MCMSVPYECMLSLYHMRAWHSWKPEVGFRLPWNWSYRWFVSRHVVAYVSALQQFLVQLNLPASVASFSLFLTSF